MSTPPLIVTRHAALVTVIIERGIAPPDTEVIAHATAEQVRDRHVIGVLPLHLAAECSRVTEIPMALTPADRVAMAAGDLSLERTREVAGAPVTYAVERVPFWWQRGAEIHSGWCDQDRHCRCPQPLEVMPLSEAAQSSVTLAEWWAVWSDSNPDGNPHVAEMALPPEQRALSRRVRIATLGPDRWVTGP